MGDRINNNILFGYSWNDGLTLICFCKSFPAVFFRVPSGVNISWNQKFKGYGMDNVKIMRWASVPALFSVSTFATATINTSNVLKTIRKVQLR